VIHSLSYAIRHLCIAEIEIVLTVPRNDQAVDVWRNSRNNWTSQSSRKRLIVNHLQLPYIAEQKMKVIFSWCSRIPLHVICNLKVFVTNLA